MERIYKTKFKDERIRLDCACHDAWCFIGFDFMGWPITENEEMPTLEIFFKYYPEGLWQRIKKAWEIIRGNGWHETADWTLEGFSRIREMRDFCNRCLDQEPDKKTEEQPT